MKGKKKKKSRRESHERKIRAGVEEMKEEVVSEENIFFSFLFREKTLMGKRVLRR